MTCIVNQYFRNIKITMKKRQSSKNLNVEQPESLQFINEKCVISCCSFSLAGNELSFHAFLLAGSQITTIRSWSNDSSLFIFKCGPELQRVKKRF